MQNFSYDLTRAVAILLVMTIHSMGLLDNGAQADNVLFVFDALYNSVIHAGVPLFLMLSGALLIGKDEPLKVFFGKRMKRVLVPFLVWNVVVFAIRSFSGEYSIGGGKTSLFIKGLISNNIYGIFWYVYLIIGLYLLTPLFRKIAKAGKGTMVYLMIVLLLMWLADTAGWNLPVLNWLTPSHIVYVCYFVAGYIIVKYLRDRKRFRLIATMAFVVCFAVSFAMKLFRIHESFSILPLSLSLFCMLIAWENLWNRLPDAAKSMISFVSATSYGIYLTHFMFISVLLKVGLQNYVPLCVEPIVMVVTVLALEVVFMWTLRKMKIGRWLM